MVEAGTLGISKSLKAIAKMAGIVQTDIGNRGIKNIFPENNPRQFQDAAKVLLSSKRVAILTGFSCIIDSPPHIETDGIAGAFAIAKSLATLGTKVSILMDKHSEEIMREITHGYFNEISVDLASRVELLCYTCGKGTLSEAEKQQLAELSSNCDAIVSIERPSVNPTGSYMTMRAIDIIGLTSEFDQYLFPQVGKPKFNPNQALISIGDGGNEVGMGFVIDKVKEFIPNGDKICANTVCDHLLVSDTSNFGGYALCNAMQIQAFALYKKDKASFMALFPETFSGMIEAI